ncbi:MAG: polysaccharide biosynthesis tyrosine autokinase [Prevotellaceae bacterium]|jgi:capsular exopolysaccharide synthesis family protein|nr:polysaccharide biosynthesis tyrosine autokinase [Prevotellaceae bacterium]
MEEKYKGEKEEDVIDVREILFRYLVHWKWFVFSGFICVLLALFYLRVTMPEYNISSVIMINDEKKGAGLASELSLFEGMNLMGGTSTDNEVEVLKSKSLIRDVIKDLELNVNYVETGFLGRKRSLYKSSPVLADISSINFSERFFPVRISLNDLNTDQVSVLAETTNSDGDDVIISDTVYSSFPIVLKTPYGKLHLLQSDIEIDPDNEISDIVISISSPISVAKGYLGALSVAPVNKNSSVVRLNLKNTNRLRGEDFLNKLIEKYNASAVEDKNKIAERTGEFIEERILLIGKELGTTEIELENYKRKEGLTEIKVNSELFLRESTEYERKRVENETQLNLIRFLNEYVGNSENAETVLPSNIGIADVGLLSQINKYNEVLLERNRLLRTTSEKNPVVVNQNLLISSLYENIRSLVKNVESSLLITRENLDKQAEDFRRRIGNVPTQERQFVEIDRQRQIQSALFLMLLQKREENALAMAATTNKARIIDETLADSNPVSPRRMIILLGAILIAILIPAGIIYLKDLLKVHFDSRSEIERERLTKLPILGEIPLINEETAEIKRISDEYFRSLRTNIGFMLDDPDKKVILVTSSVPGEGKTFVSTNIAKSFALLNKKVLLIGMDIRNPRLKDAFALPSRVGLVDYLVGSEKEVKNITHKVPGYAHLDVIFAGITPPNPAELLSKDSLDKLIKQQRAVYDYIIIDTAPVGAIIDTLILSRIGDMTLYVCRANYTNKGLFEMINDISAEDKLPRVTMVVNGVKGSDLAGKYGKYGKYGTYGEVV